MVGEYLATFIKSLNELGVSYDDVTLVGHSLGGQISGIAGGYLDGQIGQIFGKESFFLNNFLIILRKIST